MFFKKHGMTAIDEKELKDTKGLKEIRGITTNEIYEL